MSSEQSAWSTVEHEPEDVVCADADADAASAHPRGAGFRVLSRMARERAESPDYSPRHRLDGESDALPSPG
jgi:hypothetical protein